MTEITANFDFNVTATINSLLEVTNVACDPIYLAVKRNGKDFYVKKYSTAFCSLNQINCEVIESTDIISQALPIVNADVRTALQNDGYTIITITCSPTVTVV